MPTKKPDLSKFKELDLSQAPTWKIASATAGDFVSGVIVKMKLVTGLGKKRDEERRVMILEG